MGPETPTCNGTRTTFMSDWIIKDHKAKPVVIQPLTWWTLVKLRISVWWHNKVQRFHEVVGFLKHDQEVFRIWRQQGIESVTEVLVEHEERRCFYCAARNWTFKDLGN